MKATPFDQIISVVLSRGKGVTLKELAAAHALVKEERRSEPDQELVCHLRRRLGLRAGTVAGAASVETRSDPKGQLHLEGMA